MTKIRALFDTNLYINLLLSQDPAGSAVGFAIQAGSQRAFSLLLPDGVVAELGAVVARRAYLRHRISQEKVDTLLASLVEFAIRLPIFEEALPRVSRDPHDDYLIALALLHVADFIVTRDKDLLDLGEVANVRIIDPGAFLALLRTKRD